MDGGVGMLTFKYAMHLPVDVEKVSVFVTNPILPARLICA